MHHGDTEGTEKATEQELAITMLPWWSLALNGNAPGFVYRNSRNGRGILNRTQAGLPSTFTGWKIHCMA